MEVVHNVLEKSKVDENTDMDKTEKTYVYLRSQPSTHDNGFQLPRTKMSKQNPENKIRKNYLVPGRLIGLKIKDVSKNKPIDEDYETYLHGSPSPSLGDIILKGENEELIQLNDKTRETYIAVVPRRGGTVGLEGEKRKTKMKSKKLTILTISDPWELSV